MNSHYHGSLMEQSTKPWIEVSSFWRRAGGHLEEEIGTVPIREVG